jgi:hypothetical protein
MEIFNNNLFISFSVAFIYFALKYLSEKDQEKKKKLFKDSFLVGIITFSVLILKTHFTQLVSTNKTAVFTNEPQF